MVSAELWLIGVLITVLIAVLGTLGGILKITYDLTGKVNQALFGPSDESPGFIEESRTRHRELNEAHDKVYNQLLIQGRLLSELTYAFADVTEQLHHDEDIDVNVNLDRIHRLREHREDDVDEMD